MSATLFENLFEQSPLAMQIFSPDGTVLAVNNAWEKLWAVSAAAVKGGKYNVLQDKQLQTKGITPYLLSAFSGNATRIPPVYYDPNEIGFEGRAMWVECLVYPIKNSRGSVRQIVLFQEDVMDRKSSDEKFASSRFELLFENAPFSIQLISSDGWTTRVNPAWKELWGNEYEKIVAGGRSYNILTDKQLEEVGIASYIRRGFSGETVKVPAILYDGSRNDLDTIRPRWIAATLYPVKDSEGKIAEMVLIHEDATDRIQLEEASREIREELRRRIEAQNEKLRNVNEALKLEIAGRKNAEAALVQRARELARSNEELEAYALVISHDLAGPLYTAEQDAVQLEEKLRGSRSGKSLSIVSHLIERICYCRMLIKDLLNYSQVSLLQSTSLPVNSQAAVQNACSNLRALIEQTGSKISFENLPVVMAEDIQLTQVFQNVIGNALKFKGEKKPSIRIEAAAHEDGWLFSVRDNGPGIDPKYLDAIFEIFRRFPNDNPSAAGTGIGLAICKKIVERLGGKIWAESTPGQGATFFFTLSGH